MNTVPKFAGTLSAFRVAALAAIGLAVVPWTFAQIAPTANTQTQTPASAAAATMTPVTTSATSDEEQVVRLNPFEVSTSRDVGYQANETLAGTRIRTDLKDVSASISVVTKEFLDDIGANNSGSLLNYTTNTQVAGPLGTAALVGNAASVDESGNLRNPAGAQRVRGLAAADNARDYYITDIPWDSYNTDRIDILRGPNSILYGLGSPAGIINETTRNAEFDNRGEVSARDGSYGSARVTLDFNQQLLENVLAIRVDGMWDDAKYEQQPAFDNDKRIYGALRFDPQLFKNRSFHTSIKMKLEHGNVNADRPRTVPPNDAITAWWRPTAVSASNPFGGAGMTLVNNPYDPWRTDNAVAGSSRGLTESATANYQPYITDQANQQQPYWLIDGTTNQLYAVNGGYINNGALYSNGTFSGISNGMIGKQTNGMFYGLSNLPGAVTAYNNASSPGFPSVGAFPLAKYGQYRNMSLLNPSVFNFDNTLIDGPTKSEFQYWTAYNLDLTQTAWDDRVGFDVTYDRQKNKWGGQALLGGSPTLTLDILQNFLDYYQNPGTGGVSNANVGRPYVMGGGNNGGNSYTSDRQVRRASLFGELRASDFLQNSFLVKLLGKHRFNFVASEEDYFNENRSWQMYANSQAWAGYWNGNNGLSDTFQDRPPEAMIYLGSSVINHASPSGLNIPGITAPVALQSHGVYVFDTTWKNPTGVNPGDPWTVPSSLAVVYPGGPPTVSSGAYPYWTQSSNPANYVGWNSNFQDQLLNYDGGEDDSLLTLAQKQLRETQSYSGSYQGYLWNNALVATLGWRFDEVKTKGVTAQQQSLDRSILDLQPDVYNLPGVFPGNQIAKGHSTSGGAVLHLNDILPHDPLPINVSLGYDESSNFQVTSQRVDVYGNPISNPTGKTYEYDLLLSTKNGMFSFRAVQFKTTISNGAANLANPQGLGQTISQGLRWRNVFLYQLGGYDLGTVNQPSYRNTWTQMYPTETAAQAQAEEDAAITTWNNIQTTLAAKGFFKAWNFTPTTASALTTRTQYLTNPSAYQPAAATVYAYTATAPQGFTVTADTQAKGDEFELTANPLPNWRIEINASKTQSIQTNVGGSTLDQYVSYITSQLINSDGTLTPAGKMAQFGSQPIYTYLWGPWLSNYTLLKLTQGTVVPELHKWMYNIVTNYQFTPGFLNGYLKGVGVGAAYRWQDKVVIGYPVTSTGSFDLTQPYYGPTEGYVDLWASYERKLTSKVNWKIQLNVTNVGQGNGLLPVSIEPDGHTWATVRTKPTQEWFVTNTFSF
jgi:outer membrane receptor protein involved in Fe transport